MLIPTLLAAGALAVVGFVLYCWISYLQQRKWIRSLPDRATVSEDETTGSPQVSILVAARNEESSLEDTLRSLLLLRYPDYEIIVVNDRSTDSTGGIADRLSREATRSTPGVLLTVHHVKELPEGWLGKNHALYQGYLRAKGELLLFTDADVIFTPDALGAAVAAMREEKADHVTCAPRMLTGGFWLGAFVRFFLFSLNLFLEPWRANNDRSPRSMGVGAFNLISRSAYERIGTHRALAYRPDDDLKLGRMVKACGMRQRLLAGGNHLQVEWYPSLLEAVRGLEKNMFSGFRYKLWMAAGAAVGQVVAFVFPLMGFALTFPHASSWLYLAAYVLTGVLYVTTVRSLSGHGPLLLEALALPATALLLVYVLVRSVALTYWRGGVYWRGTFYSLKELRRNYE